MLTFFLFLRPVCVLRLQGQVSYFSVLDIPAEPPILSLCGAFFQLRASLMNNVIVLWTE